MSIAGYIKDIYLHPAKYNKFWMALSAPLGVLLLAMAPTDTEAAFVVTSVEWYQVMLSVGVALGVFGVANKK